MELTRREHEENARDWIGASLEPLSAGERVDRDQLAEQLAYTDCDDDDVEEIAQLIEQFSCECDD